MLSVYSVRLHPSIKAFFLQGLLSMTQNVENSVKKQSGTQEI